jgi:hypothetical protein
MGVAVVGRGLGSGFDTQWNDILMILFAGSLMLATTERFFTDCCNWQYIPGCIDLMMRAARLAAPNKPQDSIGLRTPQIRSKRADMPAGATTTK